MRDQARSPAPATPVECCLEDKLQALRRRLGPGDAAVETHFAWVFLCGDRAWKLRKPVRRDTMDFRKLEARRLDSETEVRVNRRLAPDVYLGTRALRRDARGVLAVDGEGDVVDWLVEMRRLDRARMLDRALVLGTATAADLERVAAQLARFYAAQPAECAAPGQYAARLRAQVDANHRVLAGLDEAAAADLRQAQLSVIEACHVLLDARAAAGCIVEAHGDLRPEHIVLEDPPVVIDCLEFDRELRILDRAEELAFLLLECDRVGQGTAGRRIAGDCLARLDDRVPPALSRLYRSHRAATRAKLYVWRAAEPDGDAPAPWLLLAREYLAAARAAAHSALGVSAA
jgi:aminoglycoside phosphotransferase family enzyme